MSWQLGNGTGVRQSPAGALGTGEIAASSGKFANQGWQQAADHNTVFYIPRNENDGFGEWANLSKIEPSPACYTFDFTPASSGGNWGVCFFFGGPGGSGC